MPQYRPALLILAGLFVAGVGLSEVLHSLIPLALAWCVGVGLMLRYRVAWFGARLVRRETEPVKYWIGVVPQALVATILTIAAIGSLTG